MKIRHVVFLASAIGIILLIKQSTPPYLPDEPYLERTFEPKTGYAHLFFGPLDINSASLEELTVLPGIGEKRAEGILTLRASVGFFFSRDEICLPGGPISPRLAMSITPYIKAGD
ncbi:MAG: ComEA family DNA-binding protein [Dissulfurimicrobium sp.]|uniref:ComEA family DNA-binding protein n=1 Tax=Dissulfurimicrobium TaxID=1769732 RepID=UPI003C748397